MDMGAPMMESSMDMGAPMMGSMDMGAPMMGSMDMGAPMMESSMDMDSNDDGSNGSSGSADFQCLPYFFLTGVEAGSSNGCWNGRVLSSISDPTCTVQCMSGYSG